MLLSVDSVRTSAKPSWVSNSFRRVASLLSILSPSWNKSQRRSLGRVAGDDWSFVSVTGNQVDIFECGTAYCLQRGIETGLDGGNLSLCEFAQRIRDLTCNGPTPVNNHPGSIHACLQLSVLQSHENVERN